MKESLILLEKISEKEHAEIDEIEAEMRAGKTAPWRQVFK